MLRTLEALAARAEMRKVMLTVFCMNHAARSFYRRQGYLVDATSPIDETKASGASYHYLILSKPMRSQATRALREWAQDTVSVPE